MATGEMYAFVTAYEGSNSVSHYAMGGVFADSVAAARRLGHDLDSTEEPRVEMLVAAPQSGLVVTVHIDGWWYGGDPDEDPTLMYWRECRPGWDAMSTYLGPTVPDRESDDHHCIVVPSRAWDADPRLHATNWGDPNAGVERAGGMEDAAGWERRMRARTHAAMAKALGF